jgi:hypothetical protein
LPRSKHEDTGESLAVADTGMYDEREWWLSTDSMTVAIKTKKTKLGLTVVTDGPPIIRRFINQPATNLERWLRKQGGLQWKRLA